MAHNLGYLCYALAVVFGIGALYCWPAGADSGKRWWDSMDAFFDFLSMLFEPGGWKSVTFTVLAIACVIGGVVLTTR